MTISPLLRLSIVDRTSEIAFFDNSNVNTANNKASLQHAAIRVVVESGKRAPSSAAPKFERVQGKSHITSYLRCIAHV